MNDSAAKDMEDICKWYVAILGDIQADAGVLIRQVKEVLRSVQDGDWSPAERDKIMIAQAFVFRLTGIPFEKHAAEARKHAR